MIIVTKVLLMLIGFSGLIMCYWYLLRRGLLLYWYDNKNWHRLFSGIFVALFFGGILYAGIQLKEPPEQVTDGQISSEQVLKEDN